MTVLFEVKRGTDGVRGVNTVAIVAAGRQKIVRIVRIIIVAGAQPSEDTGPPPFIKNGTYTVL